MKTLYELLGALPDDNAEGLRTAFRKAVKETHPDTHVDDPEAPLRFRQIVRANAILSDAEQRATYDRLLALALRQAGRKSSRTGGTMRKFASDAMMVGFLSAVSIGGYILFERLSNVIPARTVEVTARGPAEIAAVTPAERFDASVRDEPHHNPVGAGTASEVIVPSAVVAAAHADIAQAAAVAGPPDASPSPAPDLQANDQKPDAPDEPRDKLGGAAAASEALAPSAVAPAAKTDIAPAIAEADSNADPAPAPPAHDARSYRERGMLAYRDGDLNRAIADFDRAIQHDPNLADAYIDRGIAFYRLHEFDRAFADIAQAKRIESANRAKAAQPAPRKDGRSREVRS
jgi:DnaJ domain/TPR repeat